MDKNVAWAIAGAFALVVGANGFAGAVDAAGTSSASATIADANGAAKGSATVKEAKAGLMVDAKVSGMAPGTYGIHLHTTGKCDGPGFTTAGAHWNPMSKQHGMDNPAGHHMGDLPNLVVGSGGTGELKYTVAKAMLMSGANPLLDADGAAIVVHAKPDDYKTDPSGNSGDRIACGVLKAG